jgi:hypothetical protein
MLQSIASAFKEEIKKALERGVEFRIIAEKPEDENSLLESVKPSKQKRLFRVRYVLTYCQVPLMIIDRKEVNIITMAETSLE